VAHLPARTPYARKLAGGSLVIVNNTTTTHAGLVPQDMSFRWLRDQPSFDFFDVLHVHSLELAADDDIEAVLDRCDREGKQVVCTIHDVTPMFNPDQDVYARQLRGLADRKIALITLTEGAAGVLRQALGDQQHVTVLPHGHVLPLHDPRWQSPPRRSEPGRPTRFAMYGGFRPNRRMFPVVVNLLFGNLGDPATISILTRAVSPVELDTNRDLGSVVNAALARPEQVNLRLSPFPSDHEIADFLLAADVLVLPYLWGTHSGQLELAFDLGIVPVVANVGYLREQWQRYEGIVPEPIWFDWTDDYQQGARILAALQDAVRRQNEWTTTHHTLLDLRSAEHDATLTAHRRLFTETR
jgi:glycosyltransferase involved in cell wall biosynthesis